MKILAIESSALTASAAFLEDDLLRGEFTINNQLTHSETLLPMIKSMEEIGGLALGEADAIAVSAGPGSFTGLRIGAATAKGLALAWNRPVIRVSTLEAMAYPLGLYSDAVIVPVMDARRGQVYSAAYRSGDCIVAGDARSVSDLTACLQEHCGEEGEYVFLGDGVPVYGDRIAELLPGDISFAESGWNRQRAAHVAALGAVYYTKWLWKNGLSCEAVREAGADGIRCFDDIVMNGDDFAPEYLRKSQAERELSEGKLGDPGQHSLRKMNNRPKREAAR